MPKIDCPQLKRSFESSPADSVMSNLLDHGIPVASSCQGEGICGKCKVSIEAPKDLHAPSALEAETLHKNNGTANERLSCQVFANHDIFVKTTYW